jgi:hypothetical protein
MVLYWYNLHCPNHEIHSICHAGPWISATKLALTYLPEYPIYEQQPSTGIRSILSCCLMNLYCCFYTALYTWYTAPVLPDYRFLLLTWSALSTRFTALFMLSHESLLQSLHYPIYGIHGIWHAGSWISAAVLVLASKRNKQLLSWWLINLYCCLCSPLSTGFTTVFVLPYPRDPQHPSCWLMHLCCCPFTALYTWFATYVMMTPQSLLLSLRWPIHEFHSLCHAGPCIPAAILTNLMLS